MTSNDGQPSQMDELLATPDLADALESEQFKRFLDQIEPVLPGLSKQWNGRATLDAWSASHPWTKVR